MEKKMKVQRNRQKGEKDREEEVDRREKKEGELKDRKTKIERRDNRERRIGKIG